MTERSCAMAVDEVRGFAPDAAVEKLKTAGFVFVSDVCPVRLAGAWRIEHHKDGTATWFQTIQP